MSSSSEKAVISTNRRVPDSRRFKGWVKPGPSVPAGVEPETSSFGPETLDALSGEFRIFQYKDGHRYSTDDVLTAWYGTSYVPSARRVLDLGSGIGSVGMTAAWRLPLASFVTVEAQAMSVRLAKKSARYNGIESRYEIREGDFRDPSVLHPEMDRFDLILGSPPYFPLGTGIVSEHEQKVACRFEVRGDIRNYCEVAARHLEPGGVFAGIFPTAQRTRVEEAVAACGGFLIRTRDLVLREGEEPLLFVFLMGLREDFSSDWLAKGGLEPWREPALVIRKKDGTVHPEYQRVKLSFGFPV